MRTGSPWVEWGVGEVGTDDVHDLFGRNEDESDGSAEEPDERSDESDGPVEWDERSPKGDEGPPADRAQEDPAESTTTSPVEAIEDDSVEFEPAWSGTTSPDRSVGDAADESESTESTTMSFEGSAEDDAGEFESDASTTPSEGSVARDTDESEPSDSTTIHSGELTEDDIEESEPTTTTPEEAVEVNRGEFEAVASTTSLEDGHEESDPAAEATSTEGAAEDDPGEFETIASTSSEEAVEDGSAESESAAATIFPEGVTTEELDESEPGGATASADGTATDATVEGRTTADDRGRSRAGGATTYTDGPPVDHHDAFETASPDEAESVASKTAGTSETDVDEGVAAPPSGSNRLPTGIDELDRAMGGGVPPGRLVVLVADPGVQSELIVDSVLAQRDTLYVTTDRPDWEVMRDIEPGLGSGEVEIRDHTPDSLLSGIDSLLDELGTSSNFVLDSVNELELVPRQRYRIFLSDVKQRLFDTGSIGLLTGVTVGHESARDLTLRRADVVWRLETRTSDREIENRLSVPKFRGGAALTETVKLELTDEVRVDTS